MHKSMFQDETTLREIISRIVIPNLMIREVGLCGHGYFCLLGFIVSNIFVTHCISITCIVGRRNELKTIQKSSLCVISKEKTRNREDETLKTCCEPCVVSFEPQTTSICTEHIGTMLAEYAADSSRKWVAKDAVVCCLLTTHIITLKTPSVFTHCFVFSRYAHTQLLLDSPLGNSIRRSFGSRGFRE